MRSISYALRYPLIPNNRQNEQDYHNQTNDKNLDIAGT